eukprot:6210455-Pleurochrysis_carterae.AAC.5
MQSNFARQRVSASRAQLLLFLHKCAVSHLASATIILHTPASPDVQTENVHVQVTYRAHLASLIKANAGRATGSTRFGVLGTTSQCAFRSAAKKRMKYFVRRIAEGWMIGVDA